MPRGGGGLTPGLHTARLHTAEAAAPEAAAAAPLQMGAERNGRDGNGRDGAFQGVKGRNKCEVWWEFEHSCEVWWELCSVVGAVQARALPPVERGEGQRRALTNQDTTVPAPAHACPSWDWRPAARAAARGRMEAVPWAQSERRDPGTGRLGALSRCFQGRRLASGGRPKASQHGFGARGPGEPSFRNTHACMDGNMHA